MVSARLFGSLSRTGLRASVMGSNQLANGVQQSASLSASAPRLGLGFETAEARGYASDSAQGGGGSWLPSWLRFPGMGGGGGSGDEEFSTMTLDTFKNNLGRARMAGALTGMVGGNNQAGNQLVRAQLQQFEDIIGAMTAEERANPSIFGLAERARVAQAVKCSTSQVDDCIRKYESMNNLLATLSARKKAGKPMPTSVAEINSLMGDSGWGAGQQQEQGRRSGRGRGRHMAGASSNTSGASSAAQLAPKKQQGPDGQPCPLSGVPNVGRNDICPLTHQKYKRCCGKAA